jgi:hypothetical protein
MSSSCDALAHVPSDEELGRLHLALVAGDRTASALLAELLVPALLSRFANATERAADPQMIPAAIDGVVFDYLRDPTLYQPARGLDLIGYLAMAVRGDLANALAANARRHAREQAPDIEVDVEGGNTEEEALERLDPFDRAPHEVASARAALAALGDRDRHLLELIADGVRATAPYAEALSIGHLPAEDQAREVKRHKDRLKKQLERMRERQGG